MTKNLEKFYNTILNCTENTIYSTLLLTIILSPLFGFILNLVWSTCTKKLKNTLIYINITIMLFITTIVIFLYQKTLIESEHFTYEYIITEWISTYKFTISWGFMLDSLTINMLLIITVISTLVHIYSMDYMKHDPLIAKFIGYLSLFTFFMIVLVTSNNYLILFLGWEGVGICSYILINFWYTRINANKSAIKALFFNKIGDCGLLFGIIFILSLFKTLNFNEIFTTLDSLKLNNAHKSLILYNQSIINIICFFLLIGAMGKSAQIGLHNWLPDAMEGPTPVSALLHAATMVTAGIFLIIRSSPLFELAPEVLSIMVYIGTITAFFAGTTALFQNDIKKIIAYSTCSQLGYMVFACGLSNYQGSLYHLINHAWFKALLFLCAGSVIHALNNEQDIRRMGGLIRLMPITFTAMLLATLALIGFPFFSGFYSKDFILETAYAKYTLESEVAFWIGSLTSFLTAFYSFRLLYFTFYAKTNSYKNIMLNVHEAPFFMRVPLIILTLLSIFSGYYLNDMFIGLGTNFLEPSIRILPENMIFVEAEFLPVGIKLIPTICSLSGASLAIIVYKYKNEELTNFFLTPLGQRIYKFFNKKWYFDKLYIHYIGNNVFKIAYNHLFKNIDKGLLERFGPLGLTRDLFTLAKFLNKMYNVSIFYFIQFMIIFMFIFIYNVEDVLTLAWSTAQEQL